MRPSCVSRGRRFMVESVSPGAPQAEMLEATVEGAPRQAEGPRRLGGVAAGAPQRLLAEVALGLLEGHLLDARADLAARAEHEVAGGDLGAVREDEGALDDVLELADVARPGVADERLQRA